MIRDEPEDTRLIKEWWQLLLLGGGAEAVFLVFHWLTGHGGGKYAGPVAFIAEMVAVICFPAGIILSIVRLVRAIFSK
jgi:hypothetical protein